MKQLSDQEISKLNDLTMEMLKDKTKIDSNYFTHLFPGLAGIKELQITAKAHIYHFVLIATFCHSSLQNLNLSLCIPLTFEELRAALNLYKAFIIKHLVRGKLL